MRILGSSLLVTGLSALLVAAPLPASAQDSVAYSSYAESQFLAGKNALGELVDIVGDGVEEEGASSTFPEGGEQFTASPLQALDQLTIPVGDTLLASEIGPVGSYAQTGQEGLAYAASGAVTRDGIVHVGGGSQPATSAATLRLSGGALEPLTQYVADLRLELGAVTSQARYETANQELQRSYSLAGSQIVLEVPALRAIAEGLGTDAIDLSTIDLTGPGVCETLLGLLQLDTASCAQVPDIGGLRVTGVGTLLDGLEQPTQGGLRYDAELGALVLDLEQLFRSLGLDLNNLPENTDLLHYALPALVAELPTFVNNFLAVVEDTLGDLTISVVAPGGAATPLPLDQLTGVLETVVEQIRTHLVSGLEAIAEPLGAGLAQLTDALANVAQILVNVPNEYAARYSGDAELTDRAASISALRVKLLAVGGEQGQLADLLLGNSLVDTAATPIPPCTTDCDGDPGAGGDTSTAGPGGVLPRTGVDLLAPVLFGGLAILGTGYLLTRRGKDDEAGPLGLS